MNYPASLFPSIWYVGAFLPLALVWLWCLRHLPWHRLRESGFQNLWLGTVVVLAVLWSLRAGVRPGLNFHLLGATAAMLMFGPELAILALSAVLAAVSFNSHLSWTAYGLNALVMVVLPVLVSFTLLNLVERFLPQQFFVYVFVSTFFGAALTILSTGLVSTLVLMAGPYTGDYLFSQYFPYFILLAFSESFLTGMLITIMVVYRPEWVSTFDDRRYLLNK